MLPGTKFQFKHPERLGPGEEAASSKWKTGISIGEFRLTQETGMLTGEMLLSACPDLTVIKIPRRTVYRLTAEQSKKIEALWAGTR
jgi:hypothetical protein